MPQGIGPNPVNASDTRLVEAVSLGEK